MTDLLHRTADLINVGSESHHEQALVAILAEQLDAIPWLELTRVGDNLVARTELGRDYRVVIGGHSDTVPANDNATAHIDGDVVAGLGAADMKGGLAVIMGLAEAVSEPAIDVTYLIYAREEVASRFSGLREVLDTDPDLLAADAAILCEPTSAEIEAGCQGSMRHRVTLRGARAHTARAWMGRNAIHRLGPVLNAIAAYEPRRPVIDGCQYHEALLCVGVDGGIAGNVVPDEVTLTVAHRYAPDRSADEADAFVRSVLEPFLEPDDEIVQSELSLAAAPGLDHPIFRSLIERNDLAVNAKLGWTDVSMFAQRGIPAVNFGPADPHLCHTKEEWVSRESLDRAYSVLHDLLVRGVTATC